jgi:hypothetical protein
MDSVPIANQNENEQQSGDKQQAGSFRGIDCVPVLGGTAAGGVVLALNICHDFIVRRRMQRRNGRHLEIIVSNV